jgi:hypothetical protein
LALFRCHLERRVLIRVAIVAIGQSSPIKRERGGDHCLTGSERRHKYDMIVYT